MTHSVASPCPSGRASPKNDHSYRRSRLVPPAPPLPDCKQDPIPEKPTPAQHRNTQQNSPCDPHSNPLPAIYHPYTALSIRTVKVYGIPRL